jgi:hypothetical protein
MALLPALVSANLRRRRPTLAPLPPVNADRFSWDGLHNLLRQCASSRQLAAPGLLIALDDANFLGAGEVESLGYLAQCLAREDLAVGIWMSVRLSIACQLERGGHLPSTLWPTALGPLDDTEAREAIVVPATDRGVEFEGRALELACAAAAGSPFELQRVGFASWAAASGRRKVRAEHVKQALAGQASWLDRQPRTRDGNVVRLQAAFQPERFRRQKQAAKSI